MNLTAETMLRAAIADSKKALAGWVWFAGYGLMRLSMRISPPAPPATSRKYEPPRVEDLFVEPKYPNAEELS